MRTRLPQAKPNGHAAQAAQVFVISGICEDPSFRLRFRSASPEDFCLIFLGAPGFGAPGENENDNGEGEPYFLLRRWFEAGEAVVTLRVDWEGIFTLFANDDGCAEAVFTDLLAPGSPAEVQRQWSQDASVLELFQQWLAWE